MAQPRAAKAPSKVTGDAPSLTKEHFFRQLRDSTVPVIRVIAILVAAGGFSAASQLNLSPVYGEIPASIWHDHLINGACLFGWMGTDYLETNSPWRLIEVLPVIALFIPFIQNYLFGFSEILGISYGPVVTEALTIAPLLAVSAATLAPLLDGSVLDRLAGTRGVATWALLRFANSAVRHYLVRNVSQSVLRTRIGYEVLLAAVYVVLAPSRLLLYALPALLHTAFLNPHVQTSWATQSLTSILATHGYELLARQESLTGYISVLQSTEGNFRLMRCDHSILGGEWVMPRGDSLVPEPIYAIFTMLEAVRLVEVPHPVADNEARALVM